MYQVIYEIIKNAIKYAKKTMRIQLPAIFAMLALFFAYCSGGGGSKSGGDTGKALMNEYGIEYEIGAPKDEDGNELPERYNPLNGKLSRLEEKLEIFSTGFGYNPGGTYHNKKALLFEDKTITPVWSDDDDSWVKCPHATAAADVDGDGYDEIIAAVFGTEHDNINNGDNTAAAKLVIISRSGSSYSHTEKSLGSNFHLVATDGSDDYYLMSIAAGDIDGDGMKELAVAVGNTFMILDDAKNNYKQIGDSIDYRSGSYNDGNFHVTRIAAGDINNDGYDEFVVIDGFDGSGGCKYYVYGGGDADELDSGSVISSTTASAIQYGTVAIGDINGDSKKEVIFAGDVLSGSDYYVLAAAWNGTELEFLPSYFRGGRDDWSDHKIIGLACFNPAAADTSDESAVTAAKDLIVADYRILEYDSSQPDPEDQIFQVTTLPDEVYKNAVAAGDVMQLGREAVVYFDEDDRNLIVYGKNSAGTWAKLYSDIDTGETNYPTTVCLPDADGDSLVVRFESRETRFSDIAILAVLASPPYWAGFDNGSFSNCGTTLGKSVSSGTETSNSLELRASYSIGSNEETPIISSLGGVKVKQTFGLSFNYTASKSKIIETTRSYTGALGEDLVIFACTPFDVYKYTVVKSTNADAIGTEVAVNIPRKAQTIPMERNKFNSLTGNTIQIDSTVLSHSLGDPTTYPSHAEMQTRKNNGKICLWDNDGMGGIGQSSGTVGEEITQTLGQEDTIGAGFSYDWEMEVTAAGALFGTSYGFSYNFDYTMSTSTGTIISCTLPNLPTSMNSADFNAKKFDFGIVMYKDDTNDFPVITYWVAP